MADNTKEERIPVSKISVDEKLEVDLYSGDFLVHPAGVPVSREDIEVLRLWRIMSLDTVDRSSELGNIQQLGSNSNSSLVILQQDMAKMKKAQKLHQRIYDFVTTSYASIGKQIRLAPGEPIASIRRFCEEIRQMGFTILRFQEFKSKSSYVGLHSVNSFILAVSLADAAKLPQHHLMNLATAALFHEVGLLRFSKLIEQNKRLTAQEFQLQKAHVQEGINLLKPYNFSLEVNEAILQHHERLDGSGYPYGLGGGEISDFGRYLGLICSYVAMITNNTYRESFMGHTAILTLLKQAKVRYDSTLVRLLVSLLSLYPVGSYVALSNGLIGRVLRNNQKDPRMPVVQVLLSADRKPVEESSVVETNNDLRVVKAIPQREITPIIDRLLKS